MYRLQLCSERWQMCTYVEQTLYTAKTVSTKCVYKLHLYAEVIQLFTPVQVIAVYWWRTRVVPKEYLVHISLYWGRGARYWRQFCFGKIEQLLRNYDTCVTSCAHVPLCHCFSITNIKLPILKQRSASKTDTTPINSVLTTSSNVLLTYTTAQITTRSCLLLLIKFYNVSVDILYCLNDLAVCLLQSIPIQYTQ